MRILIYLRFKEQLLLIFVRLVARGDFIKRTFRNESHVFNLFFHLWHLLLFRHTSSIFFLKINLKFILNINNFKWILLIISSILHSYFILLDERMITLILSHVLLFFILCHCTSLRLQKYYKYTSLFKKCKFHSIEPFNSFTSHPHSFSNVVTHCDLALSIHLSIHPTSNILPSIDVD